MVTSTDSLNSFDLCVRIRFGQIQDENIEVGEMEMQGGWEKCAWEVHHATLGIIAKQETRQPNRFTSSLMYLFVHIYICMFLTVCNASEMQLCLTACFFLLLSAKTAVIRSDGLLVTSIQWY